MSLSLRTPDAEAVRQAWWWIAMACLVIAYAFVRTAAVTEDAFITFRSIENLLNGHGFVWNPGERVQPYTHPLWALLLLAFAAISGELYHTALALSLACTLIAVGLIARFSAGPLTLAWALLALLFSEAFIEYSSASLENALAHALIAAAVVAWRFAPGRPLLFAAVAGLLVITRHDLGLLLGPALAYLFLSSRGMLRWKVFAVTALPLLAWSLFSLIYYGSIWPNSAYAKLNNSLSLAESIETAVPYFLDLARYDTLSALMILIACLLGLGPGGWRMRALIGGIPLYLLYLFSAGGDYMGGRLFSVPFVMAIAIIASSVRLKWSWLTPVLFALSIAIGLDRGWMVRDVHPHAVPRMMSQHAWMYPHTGWRVDRGDYFGNMPWAINGATARREGHRVVATCAVGLFGFMAGPGVHIIEPLALTDSFLSRLPSKSPAYPGHFERALPAGYVDSIVSGENRLEDPALRELFTLTQRVARAPLLDRERLRAIWLLNTGEARRLVAAAAYDPNAIAFPGYEVISDEPLACLGRHDPVFVARLK